MSGSVAQKYGRSFFEVLFVRWRSETIRQLHIPAQVAIYFLAIVLFYIPIIYFSVKECLGNKELTIYFVLVALLHILAKIMLCNSKRIHKRFSLIKTRKHFLMRTWLIIEYVIFMWLVYLFYPLTCILVPCSLLSMFTESLFGYSFVINLFFQHSEQFILYGSIASYILFIVIDGYRKLKTGFLPDYLGLYAVLTVISASIEAVSKKIFGYFNIDISNVSSALSQIFAISNDSMNIVASVMTLFFAIYSLYTNYAANDGEIEDETQDKIESKSIESL